MTIKQIYSYCIKELEHSDEKYIDTELLLAYVLKKDRLYIKLNLDEEIFENEEIQIKKHISCLKLNKPIHYITKHRDFFGYDFQLDENVLIPRSDTELLVENALLNLNTLKSKKLKGLEIGIGSGIISISLLKNMPNLSMTAVDINENAINISYKNAQKLKVDDRLKIIKSDLYENLKNEKFDFIISNPPYIKTKDIYSLCEKVKNYEPINALDGKEDGLYFYNEILKSSKDFLKDEFYIFFEIGYNQGYDLKLLFLKYDFNKDVSLIKDYDNNDRVIIYKSF